MVRPQGLEFRTDRHDHLRYDHLAVGLQSGSRMNTRMVAMLAVLAGCGMGGMGDDDDGGGGGGTAELIADAKVRLGDAADAIERGRAALELLGLMPDYTCGEARGDYLDGAADGLSASYACASVTLEGAGPEADRAVIAFEPGCQVLGHEVEGTAAFLYAGGTDRMDLEADFRALSVDGATVDLLAGYGTCGDETTYWALASGTIPGTSATTFTVDAAVAKRAGVPVIGSGTTLLDGTASVIRETGTDTVTFDQLEYESGALLPESGVLTIETSGGRHIEATFTRDSPLYGQVVIVIDGGDPVTVPLW
jgi:hypothetical protein